MAATQVRRSGFPPAGVRFDDGGASIRHALVKVPRITVYFWVVKILTTAMGEATSDYLVHASTRISP